MDFLMHYGIKGQRWGVRRFQNEDGTLTPAGKERYSDGFISLPEPDRSPVTSTRYTEEYKQAVAKKSANRPVSRQKTTSSGGSGVTIRKDQSVSERGMVSNAALGIVGAYSDYRAYKRAQNAKLPRNYKNQIKIHHDIVSGNRPTEYNWLSRDLEGLNMQDIEILDNLGMLNSGTGDSLASVTAYAQTQGIETLTIDTNGYVPGIPYTIFEEFREDPATMLFPMVPPDVLNSPYHDLVDNKPKKWYKPAPISQKKTPALVTSMAIDRAKETVKKIADAHQENFNLGMDAIVGWLKGLKKGR